MNFSYLLSVKPFAQLCQYYIVAVDRCIVIDLVEQSVPTTCYVCSSITDSTCLDDYKGESSHETNCAPTTPAVFSALVGDDGGCSKVKARIQNVGITHVAGKN